MKSENVVRLHTVVLEVLTDFVSSKEKFSAFDITTECRDYIKENDLYVIDCKLQTNEPEAYFVVEHSVVKEIVHSVMKLCSNYDVVSNGEYLVYTPKQQNNPVFDLYLDSDVTNKSTQPVQPIKTVQKDQNIDPWKSTLMNDIYQSEQKKEEKNTVRKIQPNEDLKILKYHLIDILRKNKLIL